MLKRGLTLGLFSGVLLSPLQAAGLGSRGRSGNLLTQVAADCWRILSFQNARENRRLNLEAQRRFALLAEKLITEDDPDFAGLEVRRERWGRTVLSWPAKRVEVQLIPDARLGWRGSPRLEAYLAYRGFSPAAETFKLHAPLSQPTGYDLRFLDPHSKGSTSETLEFELYSLRSFLSGNLRDWIREKQWPLFTEQLAYALGKVRPGTKGYDVTPKAGEVIPTFLIEGLILYSQPNSFWSRYAWPRPGKYSLLLELHGDQVRVVRFSRTLAQLPAVGADYSLEKDLLTHTGLAEFLSQAMTEGLWPLQRPPVNIPPVPPSPIP